MEKTLEAFHAELGQFFASGPLHTDLVLYWNEQLIAGDRVRLGGKLFPNEPVCEQLYNVLVRLLATPPRLVLETDAMRLFGEDEHLHIPYRCLTPSLVRHVYGLVERGEELFAEARLIGAGDRMCHLNYSVGASTKGTLEPHYARYRYDAELARVVDVPAFCCSVVRLLLAGAARFQRIESMHRKVVCVLDRMRRLKEWAQYQDERDRGAQRSSKQALQTYELCEKDIESIVRVRSSGYNYVRFRDKWKISSFDRGVKEQEEIVHSRILPEAKYAKSYRRKRTTKVIDFQTSESIHARKQGFELVLRLDIFAQNTELVWFWLFRDFNFAAFRERCRKRMPICDGVDAGDNDNGGGASEGSCSPSTILESLDTIPEPRATGAFVRPQQLVIYERDAGAGAAAADPSVEEAMNLSFTSGGTPTVQRCPQNEKGRAGHGKNLFSAFGQAAGSTTGTAGAAGAAAAPLLDFKPSRLGSSSMMLSKAK